VQIKSKQQTKQKKKESYDEPEKAKDKD